MIGNATSSWRLPGRRRAVAQAVDAYAEWRRECVAVRNAYRTWRAASALDEPWAFDAYTEALDREEGAAMLYARRMRRAGRLDDTALVRQLAQIATWSGA